MPCCLDFSETLCLVLGVERYKGAAVAGLALPENKERLFEYFSSYSSIKHYQRVSFRVSRKIDWNRTELSVPHWPTTSLQFQLEVETAVTPL